MGHTAGLDTNPPFEQAVAEHGPTVWRVTRALLPAQDADDAWSETFLAALRAYPDLPAGANLRGWLVTIAHRKALDVLRRAARQPRPTDQLPEDGGGLWPDTTPPDPADLTGAIWHEVAALPTRQRQALAYHYLGGLPFADVAALTGGSTDAARRAAHDGLRSLRRRVNPDAFRG